MGPGGMDPPSFGCTHTARCETEGTACPDKPAATAAVAFRTIAGVVVVGCNRTEAAAGAGGRGRSGAPLPKVAAVVGVPGPGATAMEMADAAGKDCLAC